MCGSETFAMLVSSSSMKVAIVKVKPIHHGLTARQLGAIAWLISLATGFVSGFSRWKPDSLFSDRRGIVQRTEYGWRKWLSALAALSGVISNVDSGLDRLARPKPSRIT